MKIMSYLNDNLIYLTILQYGTHDTNTIPILKVGEKTEVLLLSGSTVSTNTGPFQASTPVQMMDVRQDAGGQYTHTLPVGLDNCLIYVYKGNARLQGLEVKQNQVIRLDASNEEERAIEFSSEGGMGAMVFAGKRLNEPIAWHGPFVMNSQDEINQVIGEYRQGKFPPVRVPWDYRTKSAAPEGHFKE